MHSKGLRQFFGLVALLALQACGGGGDVNAPGASVPPVPVPAGSSIADISCDLANFELDALRLINQVRAAGANCGARGFFAPTGPVSAQAGLTSAAYGHSRDMADNNYFSHTSLDGRTLADRVGATGYVWSSLGENIAGGYATVQDAVDAWMASDGHCANLMNPRFSEFGLACARNGASTYRTYWTLDLARP
jgi:uncharacterized protein YkwD